MDRSILYISSKALKMTLDYSIKDSSLLTIDSNNQISNHFNLEDFMKKKAFYFSERDIDIFAIDLSALVDKEDKILDLIRSFLTLNEYIRIVIIAPDANPGDAILANLFALGIRNFASGKDFVLLKQNLDKCFSDEGMSYKDAVEYQKLKDASAVEHTELKEINYVTIGVTGVDRKAGSTHNSIVIANQLRTLGYSVACFEFSPHQDFERIRKGEEIKGGGERFFTSRNIDFYPNASESLIEEVKKDKHYHFLVLDFSGNTEEIQFFNKCHIKIVLANIQSWEIDKLVQFYNRYDEEARKEISFYINFLQADKKSLEKTFKTQFHFVGYAPDPFNTPEFPDLKDLLYPFTTGVRKKKKFEFPFFKGKKIAVL